MQCEFSEADSPDPGGEQTPTLPTSTASSSPQEAEPPNQLTAGVNSSEGARDNIPCLQYAQFFFVVVFLAKILIFTTWLMSFLLKTNAVNKLIKGDAVIR